MRISLKALLIGLSLLLTMARALAESELPQKPVWMSDDVVKNLVALELSEEQQVVFRQALSTCLTDIQANVHKITKRGGFDLERKLTRANKKTWRAFENTMLRVLNEDQKAGFERYLAVQISTITIRLKDNVPLHSIRSN